MATTTKKSFSAPTRPSRREGRHSCSISGTSIPFLANLAYELQVTKPMLHPDILKGAVSDQEREILKGFLTGLVGVQKMDAKTVCLEAILPKISTAAQPPVLDELLTLTSIVRCIWRQPPFKAGSFLDHQQARPNSDILRSVVPRRI